MLERLSFPDHYNYTNVELDNLIKKSKEKKVILLTTEKDYLRIDEIYKNDIQYLRIKVKIENKNTFIEEIKKFI